MTVFAATRQESVGVAVGNVLGSNIVNVCLVLGICFLVITLKGPKYPSFYPSVAREEVRSLYFGIFISSMIPLVLLYLEEASRFIGVILLTLFVVYLYQLSRIRTAREEAPLGSERQKLGRYVAVTLIGIVGVVVASYFIVDSASHVAQVTAGYLTVGFHVSLCTVNHSDPLTSEFALAGVHKLKNRIVKVLVAS